MTDTHQESKYLKQFPTGSPPTLNVVPWPDPVVESHGHKPGSPYVEAVWLGVLGPSTTLCWSRLSRIANARPNTAIDITDLAVSLGLGVGLSRNAPITRTLGRMIMFGAALHTGDTLAVRRALPDVPERMTKGLSYTAQLAHQRWAYFRAPTAEHNITPEISRSTGVTL